MRNVRRAIGFTIGGILIGFGAFVGLLFFPQILFANHVEHANLAAHYDAEFGDSIGPVLRDIEAALSTSEINDPSLRHDIFFGHGNSTFAAIQGVRGRLVQSILGRGSVLTYNTSRPPHFSHVITFRIPHFESNLLTHPERRASINLRQTLTHEIVHTLMIARLGSPVATRLPMWKQEGYGDYVAASTTTLKNPAYDIRQSVQRILNEDLSWMRDVEGNFTQMRYSCKAKSSVMTEGGSVWPTCYFISRVLWEYLVDVKGLTFDEVLDPYVTDADTLTELIDAYATNDHG